jgi:hypothetical protein
MRALLLLAGAIALVACVRLDQGQRSFAALADYPAGTEPISIVAACPVENVFIIDGDGPLSAEHDHPTGKAP